MLEKHVSAKVTKFIKAHLLTRMSDMESRITDLSTKLSEKFERILSLENNLIDLQQYSRRNSVRISGVPESETESTDEVMLKF